MFLLCSHRFLALIPSDFSASSPNTPDVRHLIKVFPEEAVSLTSLCGACLFLHSPGAIGHSGPPPPCHPGVRPVLTLEAPAILWTVTLPTVLMLPSTCPHPTTQGGFQPWLSLLSASAPAMALSLHTNLSSPRASQILDLLNYSALQPGAPGILPPRGTTHLCLRSETPKSPSLRVVASNSLLLSLHPVSKLIL